MDPGVQIFVPFFGMMLLTLSVWTVMYYKRISFMLRNRINAQDLATTERAAAIIPERVHYPAYNFRNLFELPVIFYSLCVYLYVTGNVDAIYLAGAYVFLVLRVVHSLIHCIFNKVILRYAVYKAGAIVLWLMVIRASFQLFSAAL